jgi:hypothetical protein
VKQYQAQGLTVVGICVAVGAILGFAFLIGRAAVGPRGNQVATSQPVVAQPSPAYQAPLEAETMPPAPLPAPQYVEPSPTPDDNAIPQSDLQGRALRFASDYFETWSRSDADALAFIDRYYAPTVRFYGGIKSREEITRMKYAFVQRWPERSYQPDPSQMRIVCNEAQAACTVSGVVSYTSRSAERNAISSGSATFEMGVQLRGGEFQIISENGRVLTQQRDQ